MSFIDAKGKEHKLLIAEQDCVVTDPNLGFDRQIIAGQPVPPDLDEVYRNKAGIKAATTDEASDEQQSSSRGRKAAAKD